MELYTFALIDEASLEAIRDDPAGQVGQTIAWKSADRAKQEAQTTWNDVNRMDGDEEQTLRWEEENGEWFAYIDHENDGYPIATVKSIRVME